MGSCPRIGDELLREIDATTVRRLDGVMVRRKVTANTRRQFQCVLRSVCRWAVEAGLLAEAPVWPKLPKMNGTVQVFLTEEDLLAILAVTPAPFRLGFELAAYAGLRAGEVRGLRWMDVDLDRGFLVVRRSITRGGVSTPKSGSERKVPLHERLRSSLSDEPNQSPRHPVSGPAPGEIWGHSELYRAFKRYSRIAGRSGFRFHDLRHAFVTLLFAGGASAPVVQRLAGHMHLTTTQRYAHATAADLERAIHSLPCGNGRGNSAETGAGAMQSGRLDRGAGS